MRLQLTLAPLFLFVVAGGSTAADDFVVIVHPSVVGQKIKRADLAAVFLKKALRWSGGGGLAVPVDQSGTSSVRKAFSEAVIQLPVAQVVQYWQKQMFSPSGQRPPPVKDGDAAVIAFVAKNAGAVGYVSVGASLPPEVKTLALAD
jgi:ABC-type phosphate transport system substrate-binding protein